MIGQVNVGGELGQIATREVIMPNSLIYYCIKVSRDISKDGEIYIHATNPDVVDGGLRLHDEDGSVLMILSSGKWYTINKASLWDGAPSRVEYWAGVIHNPSSSDDDKKQTKEYQKSKMNKSLRFQVLKRDDYRCQACGKGADTEKLEVDHIIPVSKGGKTEIDNLQTLCHSCNSGKSDSV